MHKRGEKILSVFLNVSFAVENTSLRAKKGKKRGAFALRGQEGFSSETIRDFCPNPHKKRKMPSFLKKDLTSNGKAWYNQTLIYRKWAK